MSFGSTDPLDAVRPLTAVAHIAIVGRKSTGLNALQANLAQRGCYVEVFPSFEKAAGRLHQSDLLILSRPNQRTLQALTEPLPGPVVILSGKGLDQLPAVLVGREVYLTCSSASVEQLGERVAAMLPRNSASPLLPVPSAPDQILLLEITKALGGYTDADNLYKRILSLAPELGADFASILVVADEDTLYFRSSIPGQEELKGPPGRPFAQRLMSSGLEGWVLRGEEAVVVDDVRVDERWYRAPYSLAQVRAVVVLPLVMKRARSKGVLVLARAEPGSFSDEDLPRFRSVAAQIALAVENTLLFQRESERSAQLALINQVSRVATSILSLDMMLVTVVQAIQRNFGFHSVALYQITPASDRLRLEAYTGADRRSHRVGIELGMDTGIVGWVASHGQTLLANDVSQEPRYVPATEADGIKSQLAVPIRLGVKTVGVLDLQSTELEAFGRSIVGAMETLADQLAVAVENASLYDEINVRVQELSSLNEIGQALNSSLDLQEILTFITARSTQLLDVAATSVVLRDNEAQEVRFAAASGEGSEAVVGVRMKLGQGLAGWVAETGKPVIVPDVRTDQRFFPDVDADSGFTTRSILCVPLQTKGRTIGAIEVINKRHGPFLEEDLRRLTALAAPAATAIENARLYEDLRNGIRRLEETQTQLIQSAKMAAVGELAAGVAHEINNPLTSVIGLARLLLEDTAPDDPRYEDLEAISQEAGRTRLIVRGLLDFARASDPCRTPTNLNQLVDEAILLVYTKSVSHKIVLEKSLSDLPTIPLDTNQVKQVIVNLLNNAIQAMSDGGTLRLATSLGVATDDASQRQVVLTVKDSGIGIEPAIMAKIFDPFFTTKEVGQGTGLGLSVSYGIVDRHGGRIEVASEPGHGAEFRVVLPVLPETEDGLS
jgi:signal transduction histidine kinase